jgi:PAS domain S-box-containing protein
VGVLRMVNLQALADLSADALLAAQDGRVVYANAAMRRLFGVGQGHELVGRALQDLWHPQPPSAPQAGAQRSLATATPLVGEPFSVELTVQAIDGGPGLAVLARPLGPHMADAGLPGAADAAALVLRATLDEAVDPSFVIDVEAVAYAYTNEANARLFGITLEEMVAMGPAEVARRFLHIADIRQVYADVVARYPEVLVNEMELRFPDGRQLLVEARRRAVRHEGRWMLVGSNRDVTEVRRQQERLERLRVSFDEVAEGIALIHPQTLQVVDANAAFEALRGTGRDQALLPDADDVLQAKVRALFAELVAGHPETLVQEHRMRRPDGTEIVVETSRRAVRAHGQWLISSVERDVTDARREQVRMARLALALDLSSDGVLLVDCESCTILDVNQTACTLVGRSRDELLGREPWGPGWQSDTRESLQAHMQGLVSRAPQPHVEELQRQRRDASPFALEITTQAIPYRDGWLMAATLRDITERKEAQQRLEWFRAALDQSADSLVIVDRETLTFQDVNAVAVRRARMTRQQYMATRPWERMQGGSRAEYERMFDAAIRTSPGMHVYEHKYKLPDGSTYDAEVWRTAVNVGGRWMLVTSTRDITERKRTQSRAELLARVFNLSSDFILVADREQMKYLDANEAVCRFFGMDREQILNTPPWELQPGRFTRASLEELFDSAIAASPNPRIDVEALDRPGSNERPLMEIQRQALRIDGRWIIVITRRDITDRTRAQARIERFSSALNLSGDAVFLIDRETLHYIDFNEAACRMLGCSRTELMARTANATSRQLGDLAQVGALYDRVIRSSPQVVVDELLVERSDGSAFPAEVQRQAIRSENRWVIVATIRDITERKRQQARIERFASIVNLSIDAVFVVERRTMQVIDANEAAGRLFGYTRDALLGLPIDAIVADRTMADGLPEFFDGLIARSPKTFGTHGDALRSDGTTFPAESVVQALTSEGRWIIAVTVRDVTQRVADEQAIRRHVEELTRSNKELEQFAYVTSHDLSEPLRMVASYTQLLERRYSGNFDADAREFMGYIVGGAQRMKLLIDDLLAYSRAGRPSVKMRPHALDLLLDDALANLADAIARNGATVERGPLPQVVCDRSGMIQLLQNLIGNAIKFRSTEPIVVKVSATELEREWSIRIEDNGIGISPEYFERIFVIFQRLHARTAYEGTGIGLAICKKIVERHGGTIHVESQPGKGSAFSFTLPKTPPSDNTPALGG